MLSNLEKIQRFFWIILNSSAFFRNFSEMFYRLSENAAKMRTNWNKISEKVYINFSAMVGMKDDRTIPHYYNVGSESEEIES